MTTSSIPTEKQYNLPLAALVIVGILGAIVVGLSFYVISYWPLPASVAPALDYQAGAIWGAVVGGVTGLVIGFLTDDRHFSQQ